MKERERVWKREGLTDNRKVMRTERRRVEKHWGRVHGGCFILNIDSTLHECFTYSYHENQSFTFFMLPSSTSMLPSCRENISEPVFFNTLPRPPHEILKLTILQNFLCGYSRVVSPPLASAKSPDSVNRQAIRRKSQRIVLHETDYSCTAYKLSNGAIPYFPL